MGDWYFDPISGGASVLGNVLNFISSSQTRKQQERMFQTQMDFARQSEQRQYDYMDKAFARESAYNSPAAQRMRFEQAGLNPAMMMDGQNAVVGSMGTPSQASSPSAPSLTPAQFDFSGISQAVGNYYQNKLLKSQADKTDNEAFLLGVEGKFAYDKHQNELKMQLAQIDKLISDKDLNTENKLYLKTMQEQILQQIAFNDATWDARMKQEDRRAYLLEQQGQVAEEQAKQERVNTAWQIIEKKMNFNIARATKKQIESTIGLNGALSKKASAEWAKTILESQGYIPGTEEFRMRYITLKGTLYQYLGNAYQQDKYGNIMYIRYRNDLNKDVIDAADKEIQEMIEEDNKRKNK